MKFFAPGIVQPKRNITIASVDEMQPYSFKQGLILIDEVVAETVYHQANFRDAKVLSLSCSEQTKSIEFLTEFMAQHQSMLKEIDGLIIIGGGALINFANALAAELCKQRLGSLPDKTSDARPNFHFILIPTTVLAMADVAYGSLGLLNQGGHKNRIRVEMDPDLIILDPRYLIKLPKAQKQQGLAECLKHALMQDNGENENVPTLSECLDLLNAEELDNDVLFNCAVKALKAKADITLAINAGNQSAAHLLSYGHVDAEPRESASHYELSHGDAVLLGLVAELTLTSPHLNEIIGAIQSTFLKTGLASMASKINFNRETMLHAYRTSAKSRFRAGDDCYFVIPLSCIGHYANIHRKPISVEMQKFSFDQLFETMHSVLQTLVLEYSRKMAMRELIRQRMLLMEIDQVKYTQTQFQP